MTESYNPTKQEPEVLDFWKKEGIYQKAKEKNKGREKFYFLDGPPYTSGKVHLGTAWNKALKDAVLRYKRMQGFDVWDRAGYDMHGMPTEQPVEKKLGLKHKDEIPVYGIANFVNACKEFAISNMIAMNEDFRRIGVWMDFDNAYYPIQNTYMEGEWWLIKKAHENGRLYEGEKTMHWCATCSTSLAKHELEYENLTDPSIFVKFAVKHEHRQDNLSRNNHGNHGHQGDYGQNEFLIIWTTTPWTLPFNLGIMVNPNLDYVRARVGDEIWIVAKALSESFIGGVAEKQFSIIEEFKGDKLLGIEYTHPFENEIRQFRELKEKSPNVHTVVASEEYVDVAAGTGLVHLAPGCGPEDYEVGHRNSIPVFNTLTERGIYDGTSGIFSGMAAKKDDKKIIEELIKKGAVVGQSKFAHDYAHCWRCKNPIIYRATTQWFFRVEDLKDRMRELNKSIKWVPDFAGSKNFDNWLANLRDNGITRQRYWGTPLPIWKCRQCKDFAVVGSIDELKRLAGSAGRIPEDMHKPWIDEVKIKCSCGSEKERIPDILDVWIDAGSASWNCLDFPRRTDLFERMYPADFILEGIDQIRGWFNLLLVASMTAMGNASFKAVYMHGFINDAQGRKMSKSLGNYILPEEVITQYGADTLRYYMIGGTSPGVDINYNFDDMKVKHKNLIVLWNLHKYTIDLYKSLKVSQIDFKGIEKSLEISKLDIEERYILSKLNSAIKNVTSLFDEYRLNEVPLHVEELFLELSRTYIQLTRDKSSMGSEEEKNIVLGAVFTVLIGSLKLFAPIAPLIAESIYQNLRREFIESRRPNRTHVIERRGANCTPVGLKEESIHLLEWPKHDDSMIDGLLEESMQAVSDIIQAGLALREKIRLGVRWPLKEIVIVAKDDKIINAAERLKAVIKKQLNVKEVSADKSMPNVKVRIKANYLQIGPDFGDKTPKIIARLAVDSHETILKHINEKGKYSVMIDNEPADILKRHLTIAREVPLPYEEGAFKNGFIYLNKEMTDELESEGFAREVMRRVQSLRKKAGLQKSDSISLFIKTDEQLKEMLKGWNLAIKEKVGATQFRISELEPSKRHTFTSRENVKGKEVGIYLEMVT